VHLLIVALRDDEKTVRWEAAKALGRIGDPRAVHPLIAALRDDCVFVRGEAVEALGKIGDRDAAQPLISALKSSDNDIRLKAAEALGKIGDTKALRPLVAIVKDGKGNNEDIRERAAETVDNIINANRTLQKSLRKYYAHLLCSSCFLRAGKIRIRIGILKRHTFIACRHCHGCLHLIKDVRQVIGLIGGNIGAHRINEGEVFVNLWSETEKRARNADIDVLEIRNDKGVSYDYAVNAVLITLKNDVSRPRKYVKSIPVVIHGEPPIPREIMRILEQEFGGVKQR